MNCLGIKSLLAAVMISGLAFGASAPASPPDDAACLACHGQKQAPAKHGKKPEGPPFVDASKFAKSVHAGNGCTSCHPDVNLDSHPGGAKPAPVSCASCHDKEDRTYQVSTHGRARAAGNTGAPTCADCHGTHGIVKAFEEGSPVKRENLSTTCGQCHPDVVEQWDQSVHGQAVKNGILEAPTCTGCHSDHAFEALTSATPIKVAQKVCSRCHASERMNAKFDLPNDRVTTFFESYHGMSAREGSTKVANCASCHGYHLVLPASDTRSSVNKANLVSTCQKCHPNANENFIKETIHQSKDAGADLGANLDRWVRSAYLTLIFLTIGGMLAHNLLILRRKLLVNLRDPNRTFQRMNQAARIQHALLAGSFIILVVSGFALKYPNSWLNWLMFGSEAVRRLTHRTAACIMVAGAFWHLYYALCTQDGRAFVKDMLPEGKDLLDVLTQIRHLVVPGAPRPMFKRFGYAEKAEYWAVVWGTWLMGATGALIWFKLYFTRWLPRWVVDVGITVHYFEAILATLAILVWHFYFVIFDPEVYPLNFAFWDGKVDPHHHHEEHPLDPMGPMGPGGHQDPGSGEED